MALSPYQVTTLSGTEYVYLESISAMKVFNGWSYEELRFADYRPGTGILGKVSETPLRFGTVRALIFSYEVTQLKDGAFSINLHSISTMAAFNDQSHEKLRYYDCTLGNSGTTSLDRVGIPVLSTIEGVGVDITPISTCTSGSIDKSSGLVELAPVTIVTANSAVIRFIPFETKNSENSEVVEIHDPNVPVFGRSSFYYPKITMNTNVVSTESMLKLIVCNLLKCRPLKSRFVVKDHRRNYFLYLLPQRKYC